jgi:hypothetical protein
MYYFESEEARETKSVARLKRLVFSDNTFVLLSVLKNPHATEEVHLLYWARHKIMGKYTLIKLYNPQNPMKIQITLSDNFQDNLNTVAKLAELDVSNDFLQTPFFRKWFASQELDELVNFYQVANYISNINFLTSVWDITYDYFQNYQDILMKFELYSGSIKDCYDWMKNNMTYQTYLHMVQHFYEKEGFQRTNEIYNDTFNQLSKVITRWGNTPEKITKPAKWRLQDFHDHMSHLYIESSSQNVEHHPEFIPFPVEVDNWKLYQPKNTVELQLWGRRVRNCVASYENAILKKKSAIVLIEENGKPTYTAELDYNALKEGELKFRQLVGLNNRSSDLDSEKKAVVERLLMTAIQK